MIAANANHHSTWLFHGQWGQMLVQYHNRQQTFSKAEASARPYPNHWDMLALSLVLLVLGSLTWSAIQMRAPYAIGQPIPISLSVHALPYYALRSVIRMLLAMMVSLLVTFVFGAWAAKSKRAERIIIPLVDILQSVPILSFLSLSVVFFIGLFPNSLLGPECCAIFVIFTSQVWNMILSFYQSLSTIPMPLQEAARIFQLPPRQRFWRLEVPYAMPGLLWNMMLSMSTSWFFVVASEAISIARQTISLPGIGSYIALAIQQKNTQAIYYAIITMVIVIAIYDQLLFKPLGMWLEKFKAVKAEDDHSTRPWLAGIFQRSQWTQVMIKWLKQLGDWLITAGTTTQSRPHINPLDRQWQQRANYLWTTLEWLAITAIFMWIALFVWQHVTWDQATHIMYLGLITGIRVMALIILASLVWLPIGIWIGMRPRLCSLMTPVVQFLAAFPANLLFPVVVVMIVRYHLNANIWCAPLMVLGTQWYILFNVIAGASEIPRDLHYAAANLGVKGLLWWRKIIIPGIFPYFLTGAITAAGGAWNASVIAESISWGNQHIQVTGLGHYIDIQSQMGNYHQLMMGTVAMCLYVLGINRLVWRPLYHWAEERFH